jgi:hypothetical protein
LANTNFTLSHKSGESLERILEIRCLDDNLNVCDFLDGDVIQWAVDATIANPNITNQINAYLSGTADYSFSSGSVFVKSTLRLIGNPLS